ncbi:Endoplasmic reticulum mannosyl-oligosaccharide 1,2-alpha-mannosidase [Metarhizium anisopliae]|nr:Endoplasmic reticulum mannosyl-oligosaccharide 1,2-alpha-mannosidase [Metarhizium anisopliae]
MSQADLTRAGSTSAANRPAKCLSRDLCARRHSVPIQHQSAPEDLESAVARLIEVCGLFWENWKSYRELAWIKDALLPVSGGPRDQSSGWAAILAGSLDTLWIMGLRDEFDEAVEAVCRIDFVQHVGDLPGAWPMGISMRDEDVVGGDGFISGAGEDSLFEHLPKMHELLRGGEDKYQAMARAFLDTVPWEHRFQCPWQEALWDHKRRRAEAASPRGIHRRQGPAIYP